MVKCWNCGGDGVERVFFYEFGTPFHSNRGIPRHYCKECAAKVSESHKRDLKEYVRLKKEMMFERAVSILERQPLDIYEYKEAIEAVQEFAREKPDKFDSSYEMIAAIILVYNRIDCTLQYKVGRYQCDFCIPSMKVILEIDGERHKHKVGQDSVRDEKIIQKLGSDWNVVRIKTDYLDQRAERLLDAIEAVVSKRELKKKYSK